jgi:S1-C subfamily serine protease
MKVIKRLLTSAAAVTLVCSIQGKAQAQTPVPTSVDSRLLMDAAGPEQRNFLDAVYLIVCPNEGAGTGFFLSKGVVVTNSHVVGSCHEDSLFAISSKNERVSFAKIVNDTGRDLALLVPKTHLTHGLVLSAGASPIPGTTVSTWGYPLLYNGTTPLLSVGYVSGFRTDSSNGKAVKHIVVNGAFNHGNSGGPLFVARSNEVIGVVVLTFHFYPSEVKQIIDALATQSSGFMMGTVRRSDGHTESISEAQVTAMVLNEFKKRRS